MLLFWVLLGFCVWFITLFIAVLWAANKQKRFFEPQLIGWLFIPLFLWKVVRTDWVVVAPYEYAGGVKGTGSYQPPVSPIWAPPEPSKLNPNHKTWEPFFEAGGSYGPTGTPRLDLNLFLIAFKLVGALCLLYPAALIIMLIIDDDEIVTDTDTDQTQADESD